MEHCALFLDVLSSLRIDRNSLNIVTPDRGVMLLQSAGSVKLGTSMILSTQCPLS